MTTAELEQPRGRQATGPAPAPSAPAATPGPAPARARTPGATGARVLFSIPFHSAMSDADSLLLARRLQLDTNLRPKLRPSPSSPGLARLDYDSGLFLLHGPSAGEWVLEARTWGRPAPQTVRGWRLLAADAAHALDDGVASPPRLFAATPSIAGGAG